MLNKFINDYKLGAQMLFVFAVSYAPLIAFLTFCNPGKISIVLFLAIYVWVHGFIVNRLLIWVEKGSE